MLVTRFLVGLVTMLGSLLCLIPGVIATFALIVVAPIVLLEKSSGRFGTAALRASWRHMDGHKG